MSIEGVDYLGTGPTPAELVAAGKHFRLGYLDRPDSSLTRADVDAHHAAGIDIGIFAEWGAMRMAAGAAAGSVDGARAKRALDALGAPAGTVVYFAADWDVQRSQYVPVEQYLAAAKPALAPYRAGLYGGLNIVSHVQAAGTVAFFCQTYAWSAGIWAAGVQLQQYRNGQSIGGHEVDLERAMVANFGQWQEAQVTTTISLFPRGPQMASVGPGTVQGYIWDAASGISTTPAAHSFTKSSAFLADAYVDIVGPGIHGRFVRATNGVFAGQLISSSVAKFATDPLAPGPSQAEVDRAVAAAVAAARPTSITLSYASAPNKTIAV